MLGTETAIRRSKGNLALLSHPTNRLVRHDEPRDARLLDAAVAGVVLSFNPRDNEMREKAQDAQSCLREMLAAHMFSEEPCFLPWTEDRSVSRTMADLLKKRYSELRTLAQTISSTCFETGSNSEIMIAGRALCKLAVKLDDLMDGAERRMLARLRQYVFASLGEEVRFSA